MVINTYKRRQYTVAFFLTMPYVNSWNNRWSGQDDLHIIFKNFPAKYFETNKKKIIGAWWYSWPDGWGAEVTSRVLEPGERRKLSRLNKGFCGYDWMVDSILLVGDIYDHDDLREILNKNKTMESV